MIVDGRSGAVVSGRAGMVKGRERYFRIDGEYFWTLAKADQLTALMHSAAFSVT
jgi:hypothetical protein